MMNGCCPCNNDNDCLDPAHPDPDYKYCLHDDGETLVNTGPKWCSFGNTL